MPIWSEILAELAGPVNRVDRLILTAFEDDTFSDCTNIPVEI